jgi:hypothetical protein
MSEPNATSLDQTVNPVAVERRAWVRCVSTLTASCHTASSRHDVGWPGRVVNLSAGGVGMLLRHRFRPGTLLTVELKTAAGRFLCLVEVRVVHVTAVKDAASSCWLLGCAFARTLTADEMQALLADDLPRE